VGVDVGVEDFGVGGAHLEVSDLSREGKEQVEGGAHVGAAPEAVAFAEVKDGVVVGVVEEVAAAAAVFVHVRKFGEDESSFGGQVGRGGEDKAIAEVIEGDVAAFAFEDPSCGGFGAAHAEGGVVVEFGDGGIAVVVSAAHHEVFIPALVEAPHVRTNESGIAGRVITAAGEPVGGEVHPPVGSHPHLAVGEDFHVLDIGVYREVACVSSHGSEGGASVHRFVEGGGSGENDLFVVGVDFEDQVEIALAVVHAQEGGFSGGDAAP